MQSLYESDGGIMLLSNDDEKHIYWNPYDKNIYDTQSSTITIPAGKAIGVEGNSRVYPLLTWSQVANEINRASAAQETIYVHVMNTVVLGRKAQANNDSGISKGEIIVPSNLSIEAPEGKTLILVPEGLNGSYPELFIIPNDDGSAGSGTGIAGDTGSATSNGTLTLKNVTLSRDAAPEDSYNAVRIIGGINGAGGQLVINDGVSITGIVQTELATGGNSNSADTPVKGTGKVIYNPLQINAAPKTQIRLYYSALDDSGTNDGLDSYYASVVLGMTNEADALAAKTSGGEAAAVALVGANTSDGWSLKYEGYGTDPYEGKGPDGENTMNKSRLELVRAKSYTALYVNGVSGKDTNPGYSCALSLKSVEKAIELALDDSKWDSTVTERAIYICDTVTVSGTTNWDASNITSGYSFVIKPHSSGTFYGHTSSPSTLFEVADGGNLTIKNITIRQENVGSAALTRAAYVSEGGSLTVGEGTSFSNETDAKYEYRIAYQDALAIEAAGTADKPANIIIESNAGDIGRKYARAISLLGEDGLRTGATLSASGGSIYGCASAIIAQNATVSLTDVEIKDSGGSLKSGIIPYESDGLAIDAENSDINVTNGSISKTVFSNTSYSESGNLRRAYMFNLNGSDLTVSGTEIKPYNGLVITEEKNSTALFNSAVISASSQPSYWYGLKVDETSELNISAGSLSLGYSYAYGIYSNGKVEITNSASVAASYKTLTLESTDNHESNAIISGSKVYSTGSWSYGDTISLYGAKAVITNSTIEAAYNSNSAISVQPDSDEKRGSYLTVTGGRINSAKYNVFGNNGLCVDVNGGTKDAFNTVSINGTEISCETGHGSTLNLKGAIYFDNYVNLEIGTDVTWRAGDFAGNYIYGSCMYFDKNFVAVNESGEIQSELTFDGYKFCGNASTNRGGALWFENVKQDMTFVLKNCTFAKPANDSEAAASAIGFRKDESGCQAKLLVQSCTFDGHGSESTPVSSVIRLLNDYDGDGTSVTLKTCSMDGSYARTVVRANAGVTVEGGHANSNHVSIAVVKLFEYTRYSVTTSNYSAYNTGASLTDFTMSGNEVLSGSSSAAALYAYHDDETVLKNGTTQNNGSKAVATGLVITNNKGMSAIYIDDDTWEITNPTITGNNMPDGAAVISVGGQHNKTNLSGGLISANTLTDGGIICVR